VTILLDIVIPVFGLVACGYGAGALGLFGDARVKALTFFAFGFAIPALLFRSMARMELDGAIAWPFLLSYYMGAFALFAVGLAASRLAFGRPLAEAAIGGLAASYSNTVLLGIPLLLTAFGERASLPVLLLVAFHSALMFPLVTLVLELGQGQAARLRELPAQTARGLLRNPILWGLGLGLLWNAGGWPLPAAADSLLKTLGQAAVPCALFAMGASLVGYRVRGVPLEPLALAGLKLAVMPAVVWLLGTQLFALDPLWLKVAVLMAALPSGVNVYVIAQQYGANADGSAAEILIATVVSVASVSALLYLLGPV
jgi:hypothetical protein